MSTATEILDQVEEDTEPSAGVLRMWKGNDVSYLQYDVDWYTC